MAWFRRHEVASVSTRPQTEPTLTLATNTRQRTIAPGDAFTPTRPKNGRRRLIGREHELERILQGLQEDHAHVVLYSERGRGKTSLTNMAIEALRRSDIIVARYTCEAGTTFDAMMRGLVRDLPIALLAAKAGPVERDSDQDGCSAALPARSLRPFDIVELPQRLDCNSLVCVVDEFDRVEDAATRTQLADLIKQLSDRGTRLQFLIVGVSDDLDQILGQHPSIQRTVTGVHLPLFSNRDVALLISRAGQELGVSFPLNAVANIAFLARGMPYMVQLLGLRLTQATRARGDNTVLDIDFAEALARIIDDVNPRVAGLYANLTDHGRDKEMVGALEQIARAPQDQWGRLCVAPVGDKGMKVGSRTISLAHWQRLQSASLLKPVNAGSDQFVFAERGLMHHALLLALRPDAQHSKSNAPGHLPLAVVSGQN